MGKGKQQQLKDIELPPLVTNMTEKDRSTVWAQELTKMYKRRVKLSTGISANTFGSPV